MSHPFEPAEALRADIQQAEPALLAMSAEAASTPRSDGAWTPAQILGHLIDSASNNHGRFVRAALGGDLVVTGYAQADWVQIQRYDQVDWPELVGLWAHFNRLLAHVMANTPVEIRDQATTRHNLHEVAWETVPAETPTTLGYFMRDYVNHLRHHLVQIGPGLALPPVRQGSGNLPAR